MLKDKGKFNPSVCWGCKRANGWTATGYDCPVYENPQATTGYRLGECPFNPLNMYVKTKKVRVGQQKTKRLGG